MTKVILDPGSTHMGKWDYIKELTDLAKEVGADAIKWQLFRALSRITSTLNTLEKTNENYTNCAKRDAIVKDQYGNIEFPRELFKEAVDYARSIGLDVFASAFDCEALLLLNSCGVNRVKLAYSQNFNLKLIKKAKQLGMSIWASGDDDHYPNYADKKFFCIPEYPVKTRWALEDLPQGYDGVSFHSLWPFYEHDIDSIKKCELELLEVHFTLDHEDISCPDNDFALSPKELKEMMKCLQSA